MNKLYSLKLEISHKLAIFAIIVAILASSWPQVAQADNASSLNFNQLAIIIGNLPISAPRTPRRVVLALVTAYSSTVDQTDNTPFETANGLHVYEGLVAANWLPFGTQVKFPDLYGGKIFTVNDRMNAKYKTTNVDIWMNAPRHIVDEFGAKRLRMEIY